MDVAARYHVLCSRECCCVHLRNMLVTSMSGPDLLGYLICDQARYFPSFSKLHSLVSLPVTATRVRVYLHAVMQISDVGRTCIRWMRSSGMADRISSRCSTWFSATRTLKRSQSRMDSNTACTRSMMTMGMQP